MRTRMNRPALLILLLALAALGLVACGGDDDDQTTAADHRAAIRVAEEQAAETSIPESAAVRDFEAERQVARAKRRELAADNTADNRPCGRFGRYRFAVVEGDVSCRVARRVMRAYSIPREMPGSWSCYGPDSEWTCADKASETIMAWVTCNANRLAHGDPNRSRCPAWIKRSEAQRRRAAGTDGDNRVKLYTPHFESVFLVRSSLEPDTATAEAGDLTIIWKNGADGPKHNICMEDEQGKPVFKKVVFNGGRERPAQATPRCSKKIRARTLRARAKVKPGEYTYYSSVGRQREAGMEGTLRVK
jgi:plastocyanin